MVAEFITFKYLQKRYAGLYLYSYLSPENIRSGPAFANIFTISISSAISKFNYLLCGFIVLCVFFHYHNIMLCIIHIHWFFFLTGLHESKCPFYCYSLLCLHWLYHIKIWPILKFGLREFLQSFPFWISSSTRWLIL